MTAKTNADGNNRLNVQQRRAVEHGVSGPGSTASPPLDVIAGAGSGKTGVLTARVAHLITNGVAPSRIMAITFTNKAAKQIKSRVKAALAGVAQPSDRGTPPDMPWVGTFHAIGVKLIRTHVRKLGLQTGFSVLDRDDSVGLMEFIRLDRGLAEVELGFPKASTCQEINSLAINSQQRLKVIVKQRFPWCIGHEANLKELFAAYVDAKRAQGVLDFDDMLLHWLALMQTPKIAVEICGRFDHVLVDEYQDTNVLQAGDLQA